MMLKQSKQCMAVSGQWSEWCVDVQEVLDEDNTTWPVTLSMSTYGVARRMFILESTGKQAVSKHAVSDSVCNTVPPCPLF